MKRAPLPLIALGLTLLLAQVAHAETVPVRGTATARRMLAAIAKAPSAKKKRCTTTRNLLCC